MSDVAPLPFESGHVERAVTAPRLLGRRLSRVLATR